MEKDLNQFIAQTTSIVHSNSSCSTMMLPLQSSASSISSSPRRRNISPSGSPQSSKTDLQREEMYAVSEKDKFTRSFFTASQAFALAALCSSIAALSTALVAFSFFRGSFDAYADQIAASTARSLVSTRSVRSLASSGLRTLEGEELVPEASRLVHSPLLFSEASVRLRDGDGRGDPIMQMEENKLGSPSPHVAWLMSFPNSGTSFTLHLVREASNCTTATNYALEGDIKDEQSVPAIEGPEGQNGPFLELIRGRHTNMPSTILTKTHCKGICAGKGCGPHGGIETVRSFLNGCLSGVKAIEKDGHIGTQKVRYDRKLVKKAIHIFRHPLDNVVARFHLDYHDQTIAGNKKFAQVFPRNATGFRRWCAYDDKNLFFLKSRYTDVRMRELMKHIPCMNEFYRYTQWHNLAFDTQRYLDLPTMVLHYHNYSQDLPATRDRILDWLELPHNGPGEPFHTGKVYRHYYSTEQRRAIREFLKESASAETWTQLKDYSFDLNSEVKVE